LQKKSERTRLARRYVLAVGAMMLINLVTSAQTVDVTDLDQRFDRDTIVIEANTDACYHFHVYVAVTSPQHRRGLMHVKSLPRFTGMLFVYPDPAILSMWMKNTYIPLDILFIRADGTVSSIAENAEPLSLTSIPADEPVRYVLELNGGITEELGIGPGSRILLSPAAR
jgi:hypothetical protein